MIALKWAKLHGAQMLLAVATAAMLYLSVVLYSVNEALLAVTVLIIAVLAVWTYTSAKTVAMRYLFPGIAAAMVFVVFPMVYTVSIGFTNYGSQNLLDYERARQYLLDETIAQDSDKAFTFALVPSGDNFVVRLAHEDDDSQAWVTQPLPLNTTQVQSTPLTVTRDELLTDPEPLRTVVERQKALKALTLELPDGATLQMVSLRKFGSVNKRYEVLSDERLKDTSTGAVVAPNFDTGFFEHADGTQVQPGFKAVIGFKHYAQIFTDSKFSEPFLRIFVWTVVFSLLTVVFAASLGMLLAVILSWDSLRGRKVYQLLLFLPYAVPGFISILIFKGLFNQNLGEINMILEGLFGIRPAWFSDPMLAKTMLLIVNTWLGFPYMMIVCMGLIKSIPADLYEASAVAGAGPLTNFFSITLPLVFKPLTPLLISSFAFNFNNFVLITLLTGGRPDFLDTAVSAGTTDILVSYTFRIAFQDSGQHFGLASAISTVIFLIVAAITLIQMRFTKLAQPERR